EFRRVLFRSGPYRLAACAAECLDLAWTEQQVDTAQALERRSKPLLFNQTGKPLEPSGFYPHDIVHKPDVLRPEAIPKKLQFFDHVLGRARMVSLAPDWFRAPIAVEGASPRGHDVERESAVPALPDAAVPFDVHEVPSWEREVVQVSDDGSGRGALDAACDRQRQAVDFVSVGPICEELDERAFTLADDHGIRTGRQIGLWPIRGIGSRDHHPASSLLCGADHSHRRLPHPE